MDDRPSISTQGNDHPYHAELDLERERWTEIVDSCRSLSDVERLRPGYFRDPDWSVKDLVGHLGTWMAEAEIQLLRIEAGTYVEEPTAWAQAFSARAQMLTVWGRLRERTEAADRWVRKSGAEHYGEHLPRLRAWVVELRTGAAAGDRG